MNGVLVFLSWRPTAGNHFLSGVISLTTGACFSSVVLILCVVNFVSLCPNKDCKHEQKFVKTCFLFFSFLFTFMVSSVLFPLFNKITPGALQFASIKINGNTWRNVYSQIPRIPGYEVTQSPSCVAPDFHCKEKWRYNPMLPKNQSGQSLVGNMWVRTIDP